MKLLKELFQVATPIILSNIAVRIILLTDLYWTGKLGTSSINALSIANSVFMIAYFLPFFISIGLQAPASRLLGQKNINEYNLLKKTAFSSMVIVSLVAVIILLIYSQFFLQLTFNLSPIDLKLTKQFLLIMTPQIPFIYLSLLLVNILSIEKLGNSITKVWTVAAILNFIFDPILAFGIGPFPKLGVNGIAFTSFICNGFIFNYLLKAHKRKLLTFSEICFKKFKTIASNGFPPMLNIVSRPLFAIVFIKLVADYGPEYLAAFGIGNQLFNIMFLFVAGIDMATTTQLSKAFGKKDYILYKQYFKYCLILSASLLIPFLFVLLVFSKQLLNLFTTDINIIALGSFFLILRAIGGAGMIFISVFQGAFKSIFKIGKYSSISIFILFVQLFLLYIYHSFYRDINIIWGVPAFSIIAEAIFFGWLFKKYFAHQRYLNEKHITT